nr:Sua5/YciO/YrdC/YwlC family protein [Planosporangium thailandense]
MGAAVAAIARGGVVAVKGVGGYQLVCDAADETAVARLRELKRCPARPLPVMVAGLGTARQFAHVSPAEARLLTAEARPVVLVRRRREAKGLGASVHAGLPDVGLCLPPSPLYDLLLRGLAATDHGQRGRLLAVTGGNRPGASVAIDDAAAIAALGPLVDGMLGHERRIRAHCDDSVMRVVAGRAALLRRARGYAPAPLPLPVPARQPVLAVGARSGHAAAVAVGAEAVLAPHTDGAAEPPALDDFVNSVERLCRSHGVQPRIVAHDLHPGYVSTAYARSHPGRRMPVQHHHAHVVAVAAEHGLTADFLGVAYDWPGMGDDGTLWGGEILHASCTGYRRLGRFALSALPGGAAGHRPARTALGYLYGLEEVGSPPPDPRLAADLLDRIGAEEAAIVRRMIGRRVDAPLAGSCGALFDAVAALLGLCDQATYEGEAAAALEAAAAPYLYAPALPWTLTRRDGVAVYDPAPTLRAVLTHRRPAGWVAAAFHTTIAEVTCALVASAAARTGVRTVCLGGDLFTNRRLTSGLLDLLGRLGMKTYTGERVPVDDSGIGYGQAAVAAARLAAE